jgi:hypothetical protein
MDVAYNCSAQGYLMCSAIPTISTTQQECAPTQVSHLPQRSSLIEQINSVRSNPSAWSALISSTYKTLGTESEIQDAIAFLSTASSCGNVSETQGLDVGAQHYANLLKNGDSLAGCDMSSLYGSAF